MTSVTLAFFSNKEFSCGAYISIDTCQINQSLFQERKNKDMDNLKPFVYALLLQAPIPVFKSVLNSPLLPLFPLPFSLSFFLAKVTSWLLKKTQAVKVSTIFV